MKRASRELALRNGGIAFKRARPETVKQQHAKLEVVDVAQRAMNPATGPAPSSRQYAVPPSIHFVFGTLRRRFRPIALVGIAGILLGLTYLLLATERYTATATILLDTRQRKIFNADAVLPGLDADLYNIESQLEILRSSRIADRVMAALGPEEVRATARGLKPQPADAEPVDQKQAGSSEAKAPISPASSPLLVEVFHKMLRVERKGRSYVVEVSFTDVSRYRAAKIANAYVDAFIGDQVDAKVQATTAASSWLKERLVELGHDVEQAEQRLHRYRASNELIDVGDRTLIQKEIADSVQQLVTVRARAAEAEARLSQVEALAGHPNQLQALEAALQSAVIGDFRRQQGQIQRRVGELISRLGAQHPSVVNAQAELDTVNTEIEQEIKRIVGGARRTNESLHEQIRLLEESYTNLKDKALKRGEHQIRLNELQREVEASSSLYTSLLRRFKETQAQEKLQTADASIVAYASPPVSPSYPKKTLSLAAAAFFSLLFGAAAAIGREMMNRRYHSPSDAERALQLPCVAAFTLPTVEEASPAAGPTGIEDVPRQFTETGDPNVGQAAFALKMWASRASQRRSKIVLVLSPDNSEGRGHVAYQLAHHAAEAGSSALLVDTDLRSTSLSRSLGELEMPSLVDWLRNSKSTIARLPDTPLHFCPAGNCAPSRPIDMLASRQLKSFLDQAREKFELIVLDGSPMNDSADATALLQHADAVVIVARQEVTTHKSMLDIVQLAERAEVAALGVVMTSSRDRPAHGTSAEADWWFGLEPLYLHVAQAIARRRTQLASAWEARFGA